MQQLRDDLTEAVDLLQNLISDSTSDFSELLGNGSHSNNMTLSMRSKLEQLQQRTHFITTRSLYCIQNTVEFIDKLRGVIQPDPPKPYPPPSPSLDKDLTLLSPIKFTTDDLNNLTSLISSSLEDEEYFLMKSLSSPEPSMKLKKNTVKSPRSQQVERTTALNRPGIGSGAGSPVVSTGGGLLVVQPPSSPSQAPKLPTFTKQGRGHMGGASTPSTPGGSGERVTSPRTTYRSRSLPPEEGKIIKKEIQMRNLPSILLPKPYPSLRIDEVVMGGIQECKLDIVTDIYGDSFFKEEHFNFIVTEENKIDHYFLSVLARPSSGNNPARHKGLKTTKKGTELIELVVEEEEKFKPLLNRIEESVRMELKSLTPNAGPGTGAVGVGAGVGSTSPIASSPSSVPASAFVPGGLITGVLLSPTTATTHFYHISSPALAKEILKVERNHPQYRKWMKIGVILSRKGQVDPQEMILNGLSGDKCDTFWNFMEHLGRKINLATWASYRGDMGQEGETYYNNWKNIEIIFHVAPMLRAEEHRRLIGNDVAIIFFHEEGEFDASQLDRLGTVPQIFLVVSPTKEKDKYRLAAVSNVNIKPYGPPIPLESLTPEETTELLLTKLYNGLMMTTYCPPLSRLFYSPSRDTIEAIVAQFPEESKKEYRKNVMTARPEQLTIDDGWFKVKIECKGANEEDTAKTIRSFINSKTCWIRFDPGESTILVLDLRSRETLYCWPLQFINSIVEVYENKMRSGNPSKTLVLEFDAIPLPERKSLVFNSAEELKKFHTILLNEKFRNSQVG